MASTVTFTSCIDNDEPAGIENLRGAKAELLRAKVAVEQADAAYKLAQAESEKADAALTLAKAEIKKQLAEKQKIENELNAAKNEIEIAELKAKLEVLQAKMEAQKLYWQTELVKQQEALAKAEQSYENALREIELAKEYLTDAEINALNEVKGYLAWAKGEVSAKQSALKTAYDNYLIAVTNPSNYASKAKLEEAIAEKDVELKKAQTELDTNLELLEALKSSEPYQAWLKLKEEYTAKIRSINEVLADKKNKKMQIVAENQDAIIALQDSVQAINTFMNSIEPAATADSTFAKVSSVIATEVNTIIGTSTANFLYVNNDGELVGQFKGYKSMSIYENSRYTATNTVASTYVPDVQTDFSSLSTDADNYTTYLENTYAFDARNNDNGYQSPYSKAVNQIDKAIKELGEEKAGIDANENAYAKDAMDAAKKTMDAAKKTADADIKAWQEALESGTNPYTAEKFATDKTEVKDLVDALSTVPALKTTAYEKYVAFMNNNKKYNVNPWPTSLDVVTDAATLAANVSTVVTTLSSYSYTAKDILLVAAQAAFGNAGVVTVGGVQKGVKVQPTDETIRNISNWQNTTGSYGAYLAKSDAYAAAKDIAEKAAKYDEVIAKLTEWKTALATLKDEYMKTAQVYIDKVANNQKNVTEKVATPIKELAIDADQHEVDILQNILNNVTVANGEIANYALLISQLTNTIGDKCSDGETSSHTGLYHNLRIAEENLLKAQKRLEVFEQGNLSSQYAIQWAEEDLELAKEEYNTAIAEFNYWNGKLADLMKKLYGSAAE